MDLYLYYYSFDCSEVTQTTAFRLLLVISLLTLDVSKLATTSSTGGLILPLQRGIVTARPEGRCRKHYYWSAYKAVLRESSFLDVSYPRKLAIYLNEVLSHIQHWMNESAL